MCLLRLALHLAALLPLPRDRRLPHRSGRSRRVTRGRSRRERPAALDAKGAKLAAFDLLARRAFSTRELTRRLGRRGAPPEIARAVVLELEARGYLNDEAFARWWAQSRSAGRRIG